MHFIYLFEILEEAIRTNPCVEEIISVNEIKQKLEICHVEILL